MTLFLGLCVIVLAVVATVRRVDVRVVLTLAGLCLGIVAGIHEAARQAVDGVAEPGSLFLVFLSRPMVIVRTFLVTMVSERFVVPICTAMGFAHVLRLTQCDRHLILLVVRPLARVRVLLIPGAVVVGFLMNVPIVSQTSTAVCLGAVLVPVLLAAGVSRVTTGAALLLGSSIGGELLNAGAPEINTIAGFAGQSEMEVVVRILPLDLLHLGLTTAFFWFASARFEARSRAEPKEEAPGKEATEFRVNYGKALIPLVPVLILFAVGRPLELVKVPKEWLINAAGDNPSYFSSRLVGAAMLVGVALAVLSTPGTAGGAARAFFEGAGYAFSTIIAVIVAASCFGKGVELIGLAEIIGKGIGNVRALFLPAASALSLSFAFLSGSGMAATQSLFGFFVAPAQRLGIDLARVGAAVSLGAAAGRTVSPVATVTLLCATMTETDPLALVKRVAVPVLVSLAIVMTVAVFLAG